MRWSVLVPCGAATAMVVLVVVGALPGPVSRLVADLTGAVGAGGAAVAFAVTARRRPSRGWWRWPMAVGLAGWGAGQVVWTWHRSVDGRAMTFPDVENALYLVLPVCVGAALILAARTHGRDRSPEAPTRVLVLDALLLCVGIVGLTWETTMGAAAARGTKGPGQLVLAASYTVADLALIMLSLVLALGLRRMWRRPVVWLIAGMSAIGFSDAVYAYVISADLTAPTWADAGYMSGPWLLLVCAVVADRPFRRRDAVPLTLLPYLPVSAALGLTLLHTATAPQGPNTTEIYVLVALLCLVALRQLISQRRLAAAHRALAHHAITDSLTGAVNRRGLEEFYRDASEQDREHDTIGVLLCDLDRFKPINDQFGHKAGDAMLTVVADRLRAGVRSGDVVARLGGDEFVVLLDPAPRDPDALAARLSESIAEPIYVDGHEHRVTVSIGSSTLRVGDDLSAALHDADARMLRAKTR